MSKMKAVMRYAAPFGVCLAVGLIFMDIDRGESERIPMHVLAAAVLARRTSREWAE